MKTVSFYEKNLTSEYCQKIAMIKIASLEIVGVALMRNAEIWAMLETEKIQHSH